uniref:Uncharacterized protein n=1 Tax=Alexandrium monilatum TaxID=311494 RepID=A0A7S4PYW0_9DINO
MTTAVGASAFIVLGFLPQHLTPLPLFVCCCFLAVLQVVTSDILTQGKFAEKVNASTSLMGGKDLLNFVWFGIDAAALVGVASSGFVIHFLGAKAVCTSSLRFLPCSASPQCGWVG